MATLLEQYEIYRGGTQAIIDLQKKITAAVWIAAEVVREEVGTTPNHANRLVWAKAAFQDPEGKAREMLPALIAGNHEPTQAQIIAAADPAIQAAVSAAVDIFATGAA